MSKLGPLEGILQPTTASGGIKENLAVFQQHFGDDLAAIEKRLVLHLQKQRVIHTAITFFQ